MFVNIINEGVNVFFAIAWQCPALPSLRLDIGLDIELNCQLVSHVRCCSRSSRRISREDFPYVLFIMECKYYCNFASISISTLKKTRGWVENLVFQK